MDIPIIYCAQHSPRIAYTVDLIFQQFLNCPYQLCDHPSALGTTQGPTIQYGGTKRLPGVDCFIPDCGLLHEKGIQAKALHIHHDQKWPYAFSQPIVDANFSFDLFAFIFYLVSRYEEYLPGPRDGHHRFSAKQSLAYQARFLHLPIVDLWVQQFRQELTNSCPDWSIEKNAYHFLPTYDIDMAWSFLHKGLLRQTGALFLDLAKGNITQFKRRLQVLWSRQDDPFDTFDYMDKLHKRFQLNPHYFILIGDRGPYDKNISHDQKAFQSLLQNLGKHYPLGLHPSYRSNEDDHIVGMEKKRLETILNQSIHNSRQHFLRLHFPATYRRLLSNGIYEDYSMGYADEIGFRASTSKPHYWYDLEAEEMRPLKIIPFQVMDVTLQQYLQLSPDQAIAQVRPMIQQVKAVGGTFVSLWHNSSFTETAPWKSWRKVYETIIEMAKP